MSQVGYYRLISAFQLFFRIHFFHQYFQYLSVLFIYIYIKSLADYFLEGVGVKMHLDCLVRGAVLLFIITSPPFVLGAYKNHMFVLRLDLGPHDEIPEAFEEWATASFTMPATTVSKTQVRSISVENPNPPEKWVRYVAKYEYKVQMECRVETTSDLEGGSD